MQEFVKQHCELGPIHFVPIRLLKTAWSRFCKTNNCLAEVNEYYDHTHDRYHGRIWFGDTVIPVGDMYAGIRLTSWPDGTDDEYANFYRPTEVAQMLSRPVIVV